MESNILFPLILNLPVRILIGEKGKVHPKYLVENQPKYGDRENIKL